MKTIPWKNFPIPVMAPSTRLYLVFGDSSCGPRLYQFVGGTAAVAWCFEHEFVEAMESMLPEPPLPEIHLPPFARHVEVKRTKGSVYQVDAACRSGLYFQSGYTLHGLRGPGASTKREAIEAWNKLMTGS